MQTVLMDTFKINRNATWLKFHPLQCFSQSFMVVADSFFGATAEGQWKIKIGLLSIVIGTNCVHPQYDFFIFLVLKSIYKQIIRSNCIRKAGLKTSRFDATYNVIVLITSYKNWKQQETQNK